jgi:hypothetical protein
LALSPDGWGLWDAQGQLLAQTDHVVLASAW